MSHNKNNATQLGLMVKRIRILLRMKIVIAHLCYQRENWAAYACGLEFLHWLSWVSTMTPTRILIRILIVILLLLLLPLLVVAYLCNERELHTLVCGLELLHRFWRMDVNNDTNTNTDTNTNSNTSNTTNTTSCSSPPLWVRELSSVRVRPRAPLLIGGCYIKRKLILN